MRCGERPRARRYWRGPRIGSTVFFTTGPTGAGSDSLSSRVVSTTLPTTLVGGGPLAGGAGGSGGAVGTATGAGRATGAPPPTGDGARGAAPPCGPPGARATSRPPGEPPGCSEGAPAGPDAALGSLGALGEPVAEPSFSATTCAGPSDLLRGAGAKSVLGREGPDAIWAREPRPPSAPPPAATRVAAPSSTRGASSDTPAARAVWRPQCLASFIGHQW